MPIPGSLYSSQTEAKREIKKKALYQSTIGNLCRLGKAHWIHASLGNNKPVVTRKLITETGVDLNIKLFTPEAASLASLLPSHPGLECIDPGIEEYKYIPEYASRCALEEAENYDMVGYIEDDILIEDYGLLEKIKYFENPTDGNYVFMPHRCEVIPNKGDVILSGDPDGGRPDLFWDTGETIEFSWLNDKVKFYRATNPHSGCYFLTKRQAKKVLRYWQERSWQASFQLSGPLEQAGSGMILPTLKIMKPIPRHYRILMVRHQDELWQRHPEETKH
jgi:hypothetical protein